MYIDCGGLSDPGALTEQNRLEEVADRWEEGIGRTEDIEDFLEGLRI